MSNNNNNIDDNGANSSRNISIYIEDDDNDSTMDESVIVIKNNKKENRYIIKFNEILTNKYKYPLNRDLLKIYLKQNYLEENLEFFLYAQAYKNKFYKVNNSFNRNLINLKIDNIDIENEIPLVSLIQNRNDFLYFIIKYFMNDILDDSNNKKKATSKTVFNNNNNEFHYKTINISYELKKEIYDYYLKNKDKEIIDEEDKFILDKAQYEAYNIIRYNNNYKNFIKFATETNISDKEGFLSKIGGIFLTIVGYSLLSLICYLQFIEIVPNRFYRLFVFLPMSLGLGVYLRGKNKRWGVSFALGVSSNNANYSLFGSAFIYKSYKQMENEIVKENLKRLIQIDYNYGNYYSLFLLILIFSLPPFNDKF